ncbi:MAG: glycosyltransferase family 2 protein [Hyphomicrobiaceae bacterium]
MPRLSIGIPVYNGESMLAAALDSLLAQTFDDFEIIIADNASTDATPQILAAYAARDPRIRYVQNQRNVGANANFLKVATLASAPFFKWAAHDDLYSPAYLERCMSVLEADSGLVLAHSDTVFIDEGGAPYRASNRPGEWIGPRGDAVFIADPTDLAASGTPLARFAHVVFGSLWGTHMFGVIPRRALERTSLIQNVPNSDRPLLAELALLGRFHTVAEPLFLKRLHPRMSLNLSSAETIAYVSGDQAGYSRRGRQLSVYLRTPDRKPVGWGTRTACRAVVLAYSAQVALRALAGKGHQAVRPLSPVERDRDNNKLGTASSRT